MMSASDRLKLLDDMAGAMQDIHDNGFGFEDFGMHRFVIEIPKKEQGTVQTHLIDYSGAIHHPSEEILADSQSYLRHTAFHILTRSANHIPPETFREVALIFDEQIPYRDALARIRKAIQTDRTHTYWEKDDPDPIPISFLDKAYNLQDLHRNGFIYPHYLRKETFAGGPYAYDDTLPSPSLESIKETNLEDLGYFTISEIKNSPVINPKLADWAVQHVYGESHTYWPV